MTDNRLKSLAERIERLMDERDGIQSDIRDIYAEAKSAGYVPKVLRKAITRKRMDPDKRDEEDTILDLYEDALSPKMRRAVQMAAAGATSRQIEAETGLDHVTVTRSVSLNKKSETPHDAAGVVTETLDAALQGLPSPTAPQTAEVGASSVAPTGAATPAGAPVPDGRVGTGTHSGEAPAPRSVGAVVREPATERVAPTEEITSKCKQASDLRTSEGCERITPFMGDDPGPPPPFLIRAQAGRGAA